MISFVGGEIESEAILGPIEGMPAISAKRGKIRKEELKIQVRFQVYQKG